MEHLMRTNSSVATAWLLHERARLHTYKNYRGKENPSCLAKTGFFYFQSGDCVQCVYCQGILKNWTCRVSPTSAHRRIFPECPASYDRPMTNFCQDDMGICCEDHYYWTVCPRLPPRHNGAYGTVQYILTLLALLSVVNPIRGDAV